jgi:hypothetical protein
MPTRTSPTRLIVFLDTFILHTDTTAMVAGQRRVQQRQRHGSTAQCDEWFGGTACTASQNPRRLKTRRELLD